MEEEIVSFLRNNPLNAVDREADATLRRVRSLKKEFRRAGGGTETAEDRAQRLEKQVRKLIMNDEGIQKQEKKGRQFG